MAGAAVHVVLSDTSSHLSDRTFTGKRFSHNSGNSAEPLRARGTTVTNRPSPRRSSGNQLETLTQSLTLSRQEDEEPHWLLDHGLFKGWMFCAILANTIVIGLSTDYKDAGYDEIWAGLDFFFTIVYLIEMVLKLAVMRSKYFSDRWNILDFIIVWVSAVSSIMSILAAINASGAIGNTAILRCVRSLRLIRIVKILKAFTPLLILVEGIAKSLQSMFWATALLFLLLYVCAIFCVDMIGSANYPAKNDDWVEIHDTTLEKWNNIAYFGDIKRSMFSLLSVCLLAEWSDIGRPVLEFQPVLFPFFVFFVVFSALGILNVIIGVIVENTAAATSAVRKEHLEGQRLDRLEQVKSLRHILFESDANGDNRIDQAEMADAMESNARFRDIIESMDLPYGFEPQDLLSLIDEDASGSVNEKEFIEGLFRMIDCNDSQQLCLLKVSINQIKAAIRSARVATKEQIQSSNKQVLQEIAALREQLNTQMHSQSQTPACNVGDLPSKGMITKEAPLGSISKEVGAPEEKAAHFHGPAQSSKCTLDMQVPSPHSPACNVKDLASEGMITEVGAVEEKAAHVQEPAQRSKCYLDVQVSSPDSYSDLCELGSITLLSQKKHVHQATALPDRLHTTTLKTFQSLWVPLERSTLVSPSGAISCTERPECVLMLEERSCGPSHQEMLATTADHPSSSTVSLSTPGSLHACMFHNSRRANGTSASLNVSNSSQMGRDSQAASCDGQSLNI